MLYWRVREPLQKESGQSFILAPKSIQSPDARIMSHSMLDAIQHHFKPLTHPQVVHFLAHAAVLFRDLIKVLVEAWLEWDESRQWGEVGL